MKNTQATPLSMLVGVLLVLGFWAVPAATPLAHQRPARAGRSAATPVSNLKPLTEFSAGDTYKGEDGGLYGGGSNVPPPALAASAEAATAMVVLRDKDGKPVATGVIALVSISMSNATMEFSMFKSIADRDARKSPRVAVVDCAQGGQAMAEWVDANAPTWREADHRLAAAGVSAKQVQVAWIKIANKRPTGSLEQHGRKLYDDTLAVLRNARQRFPNLRIAYLGSRIYGGYATTPLNPEPYAYEGAFVVRWLIRDQLKGTASLRFGDSDAAVPLLLWGPYLWANGTTPRQSDGLVWARTDLVADGTHPSDSGRRKVANLLLDFFTSDRLARTWFVRP